MRLTCADLYLSFYGQSICSASVYWGLGSQWYASPLPVTTAFDGCPLLEHGVLEQSLKGQVSLIIKDSYCCSY